MLRGTRKAENRLEGSGNDSRGEGGGCLGYGHEARMENVSKMAHGDPQRARTPSPEKNHRICFCFSCEAAIVVVFVVFTSSLPFYPTSSVHPVSVLIPYPREIVILWSQTLRQRETKNKTKQQIQVSSKLSVSVPGTRTQQHKQDRNNKSKTARKQKNTNLK